MRFIPGKLSFAMFAVCAMSSGFASQASAVEILATWANFGVTAGQTSFTTQNGSNGTTNNFFSDLSMTFQNMTGANNADGTFPAFDALQGTANGNPATAGGQFIQLNMTKAPAFANYSFTITNVIVRWYNNSTQTGNDQAEVHFYTNTGGFTNGTGNQMNTNGTGIFMDDDQGVPASPQNFPSNAQTPGTMQNNLITEAASSYQIRLAPDAMQGTDPHWAMASFSGNFTVGADTLNFPVGTVIGIVGTWSAPVPEPSTYVMGTLAVLAIGVIDARRRRARKTVRTA